MDPAGRSRRKLIGHQPRVPAVPQCPALSRAVHGSCRRLGFRARRSSMHLAWSASFAVRQEPCPSLARRVMASALRSASPDCAGHRSTARKATPGACHLEPRVVLGNTPSISMCHPLQADRKCSARTSSSCPLVCRNKPANASNWDNTSAPAHRIQPNSGEAIISDPEQLQAHPGGASRFGLKSRSGSPAPIEASRKAPA